MNFSTVFYTLDERVATVTMNRPERRNALNDVMIRELTESFQALGRNANCRVIILTGAENSFCAGMDLEFLEQISAKTQEENLEDAKALMKLLQLIYTLKKPVVAMVNDSALGGGCGLAITCDYVFAGKERAKFGVPEVRIGFVPALILPFLIKRMGEGRAKEFVLQGEVLNSLIAKERGLATEIVDDEKLKEHVMSFATTLAKTTSPNAVSLTKELISRLNELSFKDALEFAANLNSMTRKTEEFKKGIESFLKKEKLEW
ncbi:MAG: enoyl-CoA hydratase/isomerase family protein [Ignavibacteriae bacterium]|nr:enoyl-CoA hydratase/isomerase family protein [Ignavibacteriota bacterium]